MTGARWLWTMTLVVVMTAAPVVAEGRQGHRGGGGRAGGLSTGRQAAPRGGGGRSVAVRSSQPVAPRSYAVPPRGNGLAVAGGGHRAVGIARGPATSPGYVSSTPSVRHGAPRYGGPYARYGVPRGNANGRYDGRAYATPRYGATPYYGAPRYAYPRPYPYRYPPGHAHGYKYKYPYPAPYYPRYVAPGWYGGWGGRYIVVPRYVYPPVVAYAPYAPYYYRPSLAIGVYYGANEFYPFGPVDPTYYDPTPAPTLGGVRITDAPREAQVFVDGAYVGIVDDFDGANQHLNLEAGQHRIEIHTPEAGAIVFDVSVQAGQTITLRATVGPPL